MEVERNASNNLNGAGFLKKIKKYFSSYGNFDFLNLLCNSKYF